MKYQFTLAAVVLWLVTPAHASQTITPAQASLTIGSGGSVTFTPVYSVTTPQDGTDTGLGLRIHFNSAALQFNSLSNRFAYGVQAAGELTADTANLDGDASTDQYFILPWLDVSAQWPGKDELPLNLANITFTAKTGFSGTTSIRTTASATADDTTFQSTAMAVTVTPASSQVSVKVRGFLQGAYVATDGNMRDGLRTAGLIPLAQPYSVLAHTGTETTTSSLLNVTGTDAAVDWVLLELRDKTNPVSKLATKAALLQRDGDVVDASTGSTTLNFANTPAGSYYLTLRHRNHLGMMNAAPIALGSTPVTLDFTSVATAVYGNDVRITQGNVRLLPTGDANHDNQLIAEGPETDKNTVLGVVLASPANPLAHTNFQLAGYGLTDLNLDGKTLFTGPDNDINALLGNILLSPANSTASTNYILPGSLPQ